MGEISTSFAGKRIASAILKLSTIYARFSSYDRMAIWIYKGGERDVLDMCLSKCERYRKEFSYDHIVLVSDFVDVSESELPQGFEAVKATAEELDDLILWYAMCHPTGNFSVISMVLPEGRNGYKWLEVFPDLDLQLACTTGILKLRPLL